VLYYLFAISNMPSILNQLSHIVISNLPCRF
jgi:hypothetical protein